MYAGTVQIFIREIRFTLTAYSIRQEAYAVIHVRREEPNVSREVSITASVNMDRVSSTQLRNFALVDDCNLDFVW